MGAGMAVGSHGAGEIDEVHEAATEKIAQGLVSLGRMISVISD